MASSPVAGSGVVGPSGVSSYPGGKSGAGIYQRLINLIPPHSVLVSAFAGHCGVTRHIRPAEHTIVIDADEGVCQWWDDWRRSRAGRDLEIHHCDSVAWMRHRFGLTEYSACGSSDDGQLLRDTPQESAAEYFVFADPPYVMAERSGGKIYNCEMTDAQHRSLVGTVTRIPASTAAVAVCGYRSPIYAACDHAMRSIDHRVPTRGGLQAERIWLNYPPPVRLHDYRYIGAGRRDRERIRRRQITWASRLAEMSEVERAAMLEVLAGEMFSLKRNEL